MVRWSFRQESAHRFTDTAPFVVLMRNILSCASRGAHVRACRHRLRNSRNPSLRLIQDLLALEQVEIAQALDGPILVENRGEVDARSFQTMAWDFPVPQVT